MKTKTILRFFLLLFITVGGMFFLAVAGRESAKKIRAQKQICNQSIIEVASNTDYIFFESITRFFVTSITK